MTASTEVKKPDSLKPEPVKQKTVVANGNEAAALAASQIGYDGEGYYPITPSSEVGEKMAEYVANGKIDMAFVPATSELAAIGICTGMAAAGGRALDVTSANGLLLKAEELPAISGLGLPMVMNLSTREVSGPLNIKNGHSDLAAALGFGWIIILATNVQEVYDMNLIAPRIGEAVNLPVIVAYDGFQTSHANRRIQIVADSQAVADFVGPVPDRLHLLDVEHPHTFGPYMNDDLINTKVQLEDKMDRASDVINQLFQELEEFTGRHYDKVSRYGPADAETVIVILNSAADVVSDAIDELAEEGISARVVVPRVLRPYPEGELVEALKGAKTILVAERVSQYGANNYLANEIGASLQRVGETSRIIQRTYGIGGLAFTIEDAKNLVRLAASWPQVDEAHRKVKAYYGAWAGEPDYNPEPTIQPIRAEDATFNNTDKLLIKDLAGMPCRFEKHSACPGCGIFTNLNLFLRGIDGHVVLLFNTGCGMVVTTGYPLTSFKVPYMHNLFHNASSTATGVIEMYKRFKRQGKIKEDITFVCVSGDGGDDIGMDQLIGAALRNDPMIFLEYDNKGYMNTGAQLCYTGFKGQKNTTAPVGLEQAGKKTHHKDIVEILSGCNVPYLFTAAESDARDMIKKARKAQATVRAGGFAFGKVLSICPLNWGAGDEVGPSVVGKCVDACLHPLYEIELGKTAVSYDPEKRGKKIPVAEAFQAMGASFSHLAKPQYSNLAAEIQEEVDRRWTRLKARAEHPLL